MIKQKVLEMCKVYPKFRRKYNQEYIHRAGRDSIHIKCLQIAANY